VSSPPYKISNKSTNQFKRYQEVPFTQLRSLNVRNFGIKLRDYSVWSRGYLELSHLHTKFHPNPPIISKFAPLQKFNRPPFLNG
jgi:hypothetical protein